MRKLRRLVCVLVLAASPALFGPSTSPAQPRPRLQVAPGRVALLSLDGLAAQRHRQLLAQSAYRDPAGFTAFEQWGFVVERAVPVEPTLTAVSHASIATGAPPALTGIVSNRYHIPGTPITDGVSGFDAPSGAEALWQSFRRQGKRVGVLTFPGCDNTTEARRADFGMTYVNAAYARQQIVTLEKSKFTDAAVTLPIGVQSFATPQRATIDVTLKGDGVPSTVTFYLTAIDTIDDQITAYDTLLVDDDADPSNGVLARARWGEWFPLQLTGTHPDGGKRLVGAWCLLQALPMNLNGVKIYRGSFYSTEAYPRAFRERLDQEAGFWPGPGDDTSLSHGLAGQPGLRIGDYVEQLRRFSEFFNACARSTIKSEPFDLLMAYQPIVDEAEHALLITDSRQAAWSAALAVQAGEAVDETYLIADHAVGDLARALDLNRDALVVVSDHGMAPAWEAIHSQEVLRQAGLAETEAGSSSKIATTSKVVAFPSGGAVHLYVNLQGREPTGVVPSEQKDEVLQAAAQAFTKVEVGGEPVVDAILRREDAGALNARNAGDLIVFLKPGFVGTSQFGGITHEPTDYYGQHGFRNSQAAMGAIWLARGGKVVRGRVGEASLLGVASFVSQLVGVQPPAQAQPASF